MTKKKEMPTWAIIGGIIVIIVITIWTKYSDKKLYRNIGENLSYSTATITKYSPPGGGPVPRSWTIWAAFNVDGYMFETLTKGGFKSPGTKVPDSPVGRQYLIVYNAKNPEECILLWDYPINDSTDYRRYIEYLQEHPISKFENNKR